MRRIILSILCAVFSFGAFAQTTVTKYQPGVTVDGITYCLPRTGFRVVVTAEKSVFTPGELNKYAERYMRLGGVKSQPETKWTLKDISIEAFGVPDTSKIYSIALRPKTIAPLVTLTRDGRLMAIRDEAVEPVLSDLPVGTKPVQPVNPRRFFNQEMLAVGSKAKLSELVAQEIFDLRESYKTLLRGEAENTPKDGKQLELMLKGLREQEDALITLFTGHTVTNTEVFTFNVVPEALYDRFVVARFSSVLGLVNADNLAGAPIYLSIRQLETLPVEQQDAEADKKKAKMLQGVYYNVPVRTEVTLFDSKETYVKEELTMAQFGRVEILSDALFNKNVTTRVIVDPLTGGLVKISEN